MVPDMVGRLGGAMSTSDDPGSPEFHLRGGSVNGANRAPSRRALLGELHTGGGGTLSTRSP